MDDKRERWFHPMQELSLEGLTPIPVQCTESPPNQKYYRTMRFSVAPRLRFELTEQEAGVLGLILPVPALGF